MDDPISGLIEPLTDREIDILRLIAEGKSNRYIADELVISVNTVRWYNKQIYAKLGVHDRDSAITQAAALLDQLEPPVAEAAGQDQLPSRVSSFIGREQEIEEVGRLLAAGRLLTLTGPGGTGKTSLSIKVAETAAPGFFCGLAFVDLAPVVDAKQVPQAIASALEVVESPNEALVDTLKRVLADQELLMLIDNFEHIIEAAPLISELLSAAPELKVMVTSREALRLSGEQEYPVPPLSLPDLEAPLDEMAQSEAMTLFVQRASMARPGFELTEHNAATIAQICARLDGLPLAIELAAARCKLLTPQALLERLDSRLTTLTGGSRDAPSRQRTLRDTIAWSFNLLDTGEKTLFARLAVFHGARALEAVEAICADGLSMDVFDGLASLLDKSMIRQVEDNNGDPRFIMLETIQEFAQQRLAESGEAEILRQRHAHYYVELAERARPELRLAQQVRWFHHLEAEHENIRAALSWMTAKGDIEAAVRLATALTFFWYWQGYHVEGLIWSERLLTQVEELSDEYQIRLYLLAAIMITTHSDLATAQARYRKAMLLAQEQGDEQQVAWAKAFLAYVMLEDYDAALPLAEEALASFEAQGHKPGVAQTLNIIGEIARHNGDDERAMAAYTACLKQSQETGEIYRVAMSYENLAYVELHRGNFEAAKDWARQGVQLYGTVLSKRGTANSLVGMAAAIAATGDPERALRIFSAIDASLKRMGTFLQVADQPEYDRSMDALRRELTPAVFAAAWEEGQRMSLTDAAELALRP